MKQTEENLSQSKYAEHRNVTKSSQSGDCAKQTSWPCKEASHAVRIRS